MNKNKILKLILGSIGALVVGALSNGLWELFFKPFFGYFNNLIITIITLGKTDLLDNIFIRAGDGREILNLRMIFVIYYSVLLVFLYLNLNERQKNNTIISILKYTFIAVVLFGSFKFNYEYNKINKFEKLYSIDAPYITEQERLIIRSQYALIKSETDYDILIGKLKKIAIDEKIDNQILK